ncbi:MAG: phosphoribosylanthranilate isomerase [Gemmatimonadota bacterium]|nr:phosphoribosylanthranilate isomerase [Gemmatimonadota bacterium]
MPLGVKICCIANPAEAALAIRHGASTIGLVSAMPSGPGPIDESLIAQIVPTVPQSVRTVLLTCRVDAPGIVAQQQRTGVSTLQLVDRVEPSELELLRRELPGVALMQVIHVQDEQSVDEAAAVAPLVDLILLDSGRPQLAVKELGGTGRTHDWALSRRIRDRVDRPVYLAGGLRPENVAEAIRTVRPDGVDVCSGVRTGGRLDEQKVAAFMAAVAGARTLQ